VQADGSGQGGQDRNKCRCFSCAQRHSANIFRQFSADTGAAAGAGTKVDLGFRLADVRFQAAGLPLLSA